MFEQQRAEMRVLANWADAIGQGAVRDYLRMAEHALKKHSDWRDEVFGTPPAADIEVPVPYRDDYDRAKNQPPREIP